MALNSPSIARIPEIIIYNTLKGLLNFLKLDYNNQSDVSYSYLYKLLAGISIDKYDYFAQAEAVFITAIDDPRDIQVNMMLNMQTSRFPSIHVTIPSESYNTGGNGIGIDQNFETIIYNDQTQSNSDTFTRNTLANYNLVITSNNSNEVVLIYHVLKHLLYAAQNHLEISGLQNFKVGGQDLQIMQDMDNKSVYFRALTLGFSYDSSTIALYANPYLNTVTFASHVVNELTPANPVSPIPSIPAGIYASFSVINKTASPMKLQSLNGKIAQVFPANVDTKNTSIELLENVFTCSQQNQKNEITYIYARKLLGNLDSPGMVIYPTNAVSFNINLLLGTTFYGLAIPQTKIFTLSVVNYSKVNNLTAVLTDYKGTVKTISILDSANIQTFDLSKLGAKINSIQINGFGSSIAQANLVASNYDATGTPINGSIMLSAPISLKNELYLFLINTVSPSTYELAL